MDPVSFVCNVCDRANLVAREALTRETPTCSGCGSSVRIRAIVHLLSLGLFGRSLALRDFPHDRGIRGIGLSDWPVMAGMLAERLGYTNTFFHQAPVLDISRVPADREGEADFVIAADVLQHVPAPVQDGFDGLRRLLRPGGWLLLTVPYDPANPTLEHFAGLDRVSVREDAQGRRVHAFRDGEPVVHREGLVFHGGQGFTLEMRRFGLEDVFAGLRRAGFTAAEVAGEEVPERGIAWQPWSRPIVARVP